MLIKIGYGGTVQDPHEKTDIFKDGKEILSTQGIVFRCESIGDEQLLEKIIELLSKHPAHVIVDYLDSKKIE